MIGSENIVTSAIPGMLVISFWVACTPSLHTSPKANAGDTHCLSQLASSVHFYSKLQATKPHLHPTVHHRYYTAERGRANGVRSQAEVYWTASNTCPARSICRPAVCLLDPVALHLMQGQSDGPHAVRMHVAPPHPPSQVQPAAATS